MRGKTQGVYIAGDVTTCIAILSIPLDASLTVQCLQEIGSLQKFVFFYQLLPEGERTINSSCYCAQEVRARQQVQVVQKQLAASRAVL